MAVYSRAVLTHLLQMLSTPGYETVELVFYGDRSILSADFLEELSNLPVLITVRPPRFDFGVGRFFRPLPNGARCQVVVRELPGFFGRKFGYVLDQLLLPIYVLLDKLDLLHHTTNYGIPLAPTAQIITVHDLYQGWPLRVEAPRQFGMRQASENTSGGLVPALYRFIFRLQFKTAKYVITDSESVKKEILSRFHYDGARCRSIPLGLDEVFLAYYQALRDGGIDENYQSRFLSRHGLSRGYSVVLASDDPRKNTPLTLRAWSAAPEGIRKQGLVVVLSDGSSQSKWKKVLGDTFNPETVKFLERLPREELPLLFLGAGALLVPTLGEGFGLPALEAIACGVRVVSLELEVLKRLGSDLENNQVFYCQPDKVESVTKAITAAIESYQQENSAVSRNNATLQEPRPRNASGRMFSGELRSMALAVKETFDVYREVYLRYKRVR